MGLAGAVWMAKDDGYLPARRAAGTTLLVDGGMTAGYLQRERAPEPSG